MYGPIESLNSNDVMLVITLASRIAPKKKKTCQGRLAWSFFVVARLFRGPLILPSHISLHRQLSLELSTFIQALLSPCPLFFIYGGEWVLSRRNACTDCTDLIAVLVHCACSDIRKVLPAFWVLEVLEIFRRLLLVFAPAGKIYAMHRELTDSFFLYIVTHTARLGTIIDVLLLTTRHTSFEQETIFLFVLIFLLSGVSDWSRCNWQEKLKIRM